MIKTTVLLPTTFNDNTFKVIAARTADGINLVMIVAEVTNPVKGLALCPVYRSKIVFNLHFRL